MIESLVEQIEARFAAAQAQMSDPEVIGDRQRYADAGRLFNQLSPAAKLAEEWRLATSGGLAARNLGRRGRRGAARRRRGS
jgi:peptide chain release factor 1